MDDLNSGRWLKLVKKSVDKQGARDHPDQYFIKANSAEGHNKVAEAVWPNNAQKRKAFCAEMDGVQRLADTRYPIFTGRNNIMVLSAPNAP